MQVIKCDRCGKYFDENKNGKKGIVWIDDRTPWDLREHAIDLCDDCINELNDWLTNRTMA